MTRRGERRRTGGSWHDRHPDIYRVAAGGTVVQTLTSPGTIQGACTVNPMGEVTIIVR